MRQRVNTIVMVPSWSKVGGRWFTIFNLEFEALIVSPPTTRHAFTSKKQQPRIPSQEKSTVTTVTTTAIKHVIMGNLLSSAGNNPNMSVDPSAKSFIESEIGSHQVTIFSKTYCGTCCMIDIML
jgi:hypothetical protein